MQLKEHFKITEESTDKAYVYRITFAHFT